MFALTNDWRISRMVCEQIQAPLSLTIDTESAVRRRRSRSRLDDVGHEVGADVFKGVLLHRHRFV